VELEICEKLEIEQKSNFLFPLKGVNCKKNKHVSNVKSVLITLKRVEWHILNRDHMFQDVLREAGSIGVGCW